MFVFKAVFTAYKLELRLRRLSPHPPAAAVPAAQSCETEKPFISFISSDQVFNTAAVFGLLCQMCFCSVLLMIDRPWMLSLDRAKDVTVIQVILLLSKQIKSKQ